jgi:transketolase
VITLPAPARFPTANVSDLRRLATAIRLRAVRMVAPHGFGYLGQALSAAEQYAAVYGAARRPGADRVICSPAHYVIAAYAAAAETGLLDEAALGGYGRDGSALEAIGTERSPVPDYTCGSLGQGLSAAAGFALADRLLGRPEARTFAFLSDGELQEGQVWEAAMAASHYKLGNLIMIADANGFSGAGPTSQAMNIEPLGKRFEAFGWTVREIDGHDGPTLLKTFDELPDPASDEPVAIIARTRKGHGVDFMEKQPQAWHLGLLNAEQYADVVAEISARMELANG